MALELALHQVSFSIVEKSPSPSDKSRALVLHPRSLELLRRHGIADDLMRRGTLGTGARVFVNKKKAAVFNFTDLGFDHTAFPQPLWISQAETEALLLSRLQSYGVEVERGVTAEGFEQDESGVTVTLSKDGVTGHIRCAYVIGCDGAHSVVRRSAGLSFEGAAYPQDFILCDAHLKWDQFEDEGRHISMFTGGKEVLILFPLPDGVVRLVGNLPSGTLSGSRSGLAPTLEDFQSLFNRMAPGKWELSDPVWLANFRLHHRGVDNYRKGRCFVAGDAAHIHSPAGGQGMNTGIQDAINLGWKLAHTLRVHKAAGTVMETWLDSYNEERHRVGQHLLEGTDRLFSYASSTNTLWIWWRNFLLTWIMPWALSRRTLRARLFRFISELGIRYRQSSIVGTSPHFMGQLKGGDRAPDGKIRMPDGVTKFLLETCAGNKFHFLLFSGRGAQALGTEGMESCATRLKESLEGKALDVPEAHEVYESTPPHPSAMMDVDGKLHKVYGFEEPGFVLVRPDAYIAYIGSHSDIDDFLIWINHAVESPQGPSSGPFV